MKPAIPVKDVEVDDLVRDPYTGQTVRVLMKTSFGGMSRIWFHSKAGSLKPWDEPIEVMARGSRHGAAK